MDSLAVLAGCRREPAYGVEPRDAYTLIPTLTRTRSLALTLTLTQTRPF